MKKKAFTLVELMVVIGIIALLLALLMPALKGARAQAQSVQCLSNLRQVGLVFQIYGMDYKGMAPMVDVPVGPTGDWMLQIAPYLKIPSSNVSLNAGLKTWAPNAIKILQCPSTFPDMGIWGSCSYAPNYFFTFKRNNDQFKFSAPAWWGGQYRDGPIRMTEMPVARRGNEFVLMTESIAYDWIVPNWNAQWVTLFSHRKMRNFLFVDGHADSSKQSVQYIIALRNSGAFSGFPDDIIRGRDNHGGTTAGLE